MATAVDAERLGKVFHPRISQHFESTPAINLHKVTAGRQSELLPFPVASFAELNHLPSVRMYLTIAFTARFFLGRRLCALPLREV